MSESEIVVDSRLAYNKVYSTTTTYNMIENVGTMATTYTHTSRDFHLLCAFEKKSVPFEPEIFCRRVDPATPMV